MLDFCFNCLIFPGAGHIGNAISSAASLFWRWD